MVIQQSKDYEKIEKIDYYLQKAELDLESLVRCRDNNVIPTIIHKIFETKSNFHVK